MTPASYRPVRRDTSGERLSGVTVHWEPLAASIGSELGESEPQTIDQQMVDAHAATTGDAQWIHNDPERARRESPFGGPIAQGFLLLSLLTAHSAQLTFPVFGPVRMLVNYGFDRVRFVRPVPVGAAVAIRAQLGDVRPKPDGTAVLAVDLEMFSSTGSGPVLVARWLFLAVPAPQSETTA